MSTPGTIIVFLQLTQWCKPSSSTLFCMHLAAQSLKCFRPVRTGRADYFGNLPNLAARVSALAQPGQVLLEGCQAFGGELSWVKDDSLALLPLARQESRTDRGGECIEIAYLGQYLLKVRGWLACS